MENIIIALVCITMLVVGAVTLALSAFNSLDTLVFAWKEGESLAEEMRGTAISPVSSITNAEGTQVDIVIKNNGNADLADFDRWDLIVTYQDGGVQWLPYTTDTPGWTVSGIYLDGNPEIYGPNILNPMETMNMVLKLSPIAAEGATNLTRIATPNGVSTQITFGR
jgi:hypothetical protein